VVQMWNRIQLDRFMDAGKDGGREKQHVVWTELEERFTARAYICRNFDVHVVRMNSYRLWKQELALVYSRWITFL
jgi:hypothetical protein